MVSEDERRHVENRHKGFVEAYEKHDVEKLMSYMCPDQLTYSDFGSQFEDVSHSQLKEKFKDSFAHTHRMKVRTVSLEGTKDFTAWEFVTTFRTSKLSDGTKLHEKDARRGKVRGCSLIWWNDQDKIIRNHNYYHLREPDENDDD